MVDYIADYLENIHHRQPMPDVTPGYLRPLIPDQAPETGESYEDVIADVERVVMPGVSWGGDLGVRWGEWQIWGKVGQI